MNTKVITIIFKDGTTATFEHCLDRYSYNEKLYVYFQPPESHIFHTVYSIEIVACVVNGYVETLDIEE